MEDNQDGVVVRVHFQMKYLSREFWVGPTGTKAVEGNFM